jgi:hypothetical protein
MVVKPIISFIYGHIRSKKYIFTHNGGECVKALIIVVFGGLNNVTQVDD